MYMNMCTDVYIHTCVKWMSTGLLLACLKNGRVPVLFWLVLKMDEYRSFAGLSSKWMSTGLMLACLQKWMSTGLIQSCHKNECSAVSYNLVIKMNAVLSHTILS